jgi:hypothetical protein
MSNTSVRGRATARVVPAIPSDYLGPAVVAAIEPGGVEARLPSGACVRAALALALPYRPAIDDVVLVIGRDDAHYVVGVLRGSGETALAFEGDVTLHAVRGRLRLTGDEGVEVQGKELEILVSAFKVVADSMVHKAASAYQRVTGLFSLRARDAETLVDGTSTTKAHTAVVLTEDKMTLNGKQIYLG